MDKQTKIGLGLGLTVTGLVGLAYLFKKSSALGSPDDGTDKPTEIDYTAVKAYMALLFTTEKVYCDILVANPTAPLSTRFYNAAGAEVGNGAPYHCKLVITNVSTPDLVVSGLTEVQTNVIYIDLKDQKGLFMFYGARAMFTYTFS